MQDSADSGRLVDDVYRIQVPNLRGRSGQPTNVYVVGRDSALLIDAGSDDGGVTVVEALRRFRIREVSEIVLTHAHPDHAGGVGSIRAAYKASVAMHPGGLAALDRWNVEVTPDRLLEDGEIIESGRHRLQVIETPGHAPGHVSLYEPSLRALFAGDLLSGNGTIAVVPPLGSMTQYLASLRRVRDLDIQMIYPGHGPAIQDGNDRIDQYIAHRERRAQDIEAAIANGVDTVSSVTDLLYPDIVSRLRGAAEGTVHAHVLQLIDECRVMVREHGDDVLNSRLGVTRHERGSTMAGRQET